MALLCSQADTIADKATRLHNKFVINPYLALVTLSNKRIIETIH
jgi:hypothetical protein